MLRPYSEYKDLNADRLREVIAARDASISVSKIKRVRVHESSRETVLVDDNPIPQPLKIISQYLQAPASFLASADITLSQHIIDHQLKVVKNDREIVFREGKAVGDQAAGRIRLSGSQIVDNLIEVVGDVRRASVYDLGGNVDVVLSGDRVVLEPKVGDITDSGVRMLYSEIMERPPALEPYVERLVCLNGMTFPDRLHTFRFDSISEFLSQFKASVQAALEFVNVQVRAQLTKAANTAVEKPEQAIRTIFDNSSLTPRLLSPALAALTIEDDGTAFGVLQALTRAANSVGYTHRLQLQSNASRELARLETVHCPTCWSSLVH